MRPRGVGGPINPFQVRPRLQDAEVRPHMLTRRREAWGESQASERAGSTGEHGLHQGCERPPEFGDKEQQMA